jgi:adenylyltransferase/sulfurtransferase
LGRFFNFDYTQSERAMADLKIKDPTRDRYHALAISSVWDLTKIRTARALVVGAGALGNEVSKNLTMMGVRLISLLDRDSVEVANLTRSVFFREGDHGHPKATILCDRLKELNPDVHMLPLTGDLDAVLGLGLLRRMDMVFSCLDSRLARRSLNRMCEKLGKPWVDGAMENLLGEVAVYSPDNGPCYECNLTERDEKLLAQAASCQRIAVRNLSLGKVPTTSTMGSIVAAFQVQEGLKLLHADTAGSMAGKRLVVNCNVNDFYITAASRRENCMGHFRYGEVTEVAEFSTLSTTVRGMLNRFRADTGEDGYVELGREIVVSMRCIGCGDADLLGEPIRVVTEDKLRCPKCGEMRDPQTTHIVRGSEPYADWPLGRLGVPLLDIIQIRGRESALWYEMTGDLTAFPAAVR